MCCYKSWLFRFLLEKGKLAESCGWIFVDNVPLMYDRKRVARQLQVETWLHLSQLVKELNIDDLKFRKENSERPVPYVV